MKERIQQLLFVTNNRHKLEEIRAIAGKNLHILSLAEAGIIEDIPETGSTLESNASIKSWHAHNLTGMNCFADDTGLEVEALDGRPGVYSARYAGPDCNHLNNIREVLAELDGIENRKARFRTVISLIMKGKELFFEGVVNGVILHEGRGETGFGYDPVFLPDGSTKSFAEMDMETKNRISHRGVASRKLIEYLNSITGY